MSDLEPSNETDTVFLESSDEVVIEVDRAVAEQSALLKDLLEDFSDVVFDANCAIPLLSVNEAVLRKILEWCEHRHNNPIQTQDDETDVCKRTSEIDAWDKNFLEVNQEMVFGIILGANYMDIKPLLNAGCKAVANMMKGKSAEGIRNTFNIANDFTPEEEKIRRENKWAEDP